MIDYNLIINSVAEKELEEATNWYNIQKENLGKSFVLEVDNTIMRILENPFQFPKVKKQIRRAVVRRFPYSIFFYVDDFTVNIFAIFHTSRNPKLWNNRLK